MIGAKTQIDTINTAVIRIHAYKDELQAQWQDLVKSPVRLISTIVPQLQLCAGEGCGQDCPKSHPAIGENLDSITMEVWGRSFGKLEGGRAPAAEATYFSVYIRVPESILKSLLQSNITGIYLDPRQDKSPDERYRVMWLSAHTLAEAQHSLKTCAKALGLVRLRHKYGLRVETVDEEAAFNFLKPDATYIATRVQRTFQLFPLPHGLQRAGLNSDWFGMGRKTTPTRTRPTRWNLLDGGVHHSTTSGGLFQFWQGSLDYWDHQAASSHKAFELPGIYQNTETLAYGSRILHYGIHWSMARCQCGPLEPLETHIRRKWSQQTSSWEKSPCWYHEQVKGWNSDHDAQRVGRLQVQPRCNYGGARWCRNRAEICSHWVNSGWDPSSARPVQPMVHPGWRSLNGNRDGNPNHQLHPEHASAGAPRLAPRDQECLRQRWPNAPEDTCKPPNWDVGRLCSEILQACSNVWQEALQWMTRQSGVISWTKTTPELLHTLSIYFAELVPAFLVPVADAVSYGACIWLQWHPKVSFWECCWHPQLRCIGWSWLPWA